MDAALRKKLEKLSNGQWSVVIIVLIVVSTVLFAIPPIADILLLLLIYALTMWLAYKLAKLIDWFDDNVDSKVQMTGIYHFVYAIGISILAGTIIAHLGPKVLPFSPRIYAVLSPQVFYFVFGFIMAAIGYGIAWKSIPNKKER